MVKTGIMFRNGFFLVPIYLVLYILSFSLFLGCILWLNLWQV